MTGQGSVSYSGVTYVKYSYPGLYGPSDFHSYPADCPVPPGTKAGSREGDIGDLKIFGTGSGLLPSTKELVFVQNHDTERDGSTLNYKDPNNVIANEFMLAWPHGIPQVYSGFAWATRDDSPPSDASGHVTPTASADGASIEHAAGRSGEVRDAPPV